MKQFMTNIKTLAALLMAGAAFIACSSSDDITTETPKPANPTGKYTMTIKATKSADATTRALSLSGSTLKATWNEGEEVLVYQNGSKIGTLTAAASDDEETTLSGTLDSAPDASKDLTFHFHTAANPSYSGQDGTLTKIASSYDFCAPATVASGDFTVSGSTVEVSGGISFGANKQAIVKFTFLDKADVTNNSKLSPSTITASLDVSPSAPEPYKTLIQTGAAAAHMTLPYESTITIPDATYDENGIGIIYLAIPDKLEVLPAYKQYFDFTLTAIVGDKVYSLTKSGFPFENGQYYEITAKMTEQVWDGDLSKLTAEMPEAFATATDGMTITGTLGVNKKISIANGAKVTLDGATINGVNDENFLWAGITCLGNATIILADGTTNTVKGFKDWYPGILAAHNESGTEYTLTIQGTGTLIASSNGSGAGIGGGFGISCGNIVIKSGTITATSGDYGAGIGGGSGSCGTITISGGSVEAYGGDCAAGIGSGDSGRCGTITISGGTVEATGGSGAAGIGSGCNGNCDITISGGSVEAYGGDWGAGIGTGDGGSCGDITISSGTVTATGGFRAAGIGTGTGNGVCGDITISGGSVEAYGGDWGAGIGTGDSGICGDITISSGTVTATGGNHGAGIGSGSRGSCCDITITSGVTSVTATKGSENAASIGAGWDGAYASVTIDDVTDATTESTFEHLNSTVDGNTWTLTKKTN